MGRISVFMACLACIAASWSATAAPGGWPALDDSAIDRAVTDYMKEALVPGVVVGVIAGDELVFAKAYGEANAETGAKLTVDHGFQIASVTKVFTAELMLVLQDQGVINIHEPVAKYMTELTVPRWPSAREITFADLASHSSGLPFMKPNRKERPNSPTVPEPYTGEMLVEALAETELLWPPGGRAEYSSLGMDLLGYALEKAASMPLEALMRKHIWASLDMANTYAQHPPSEDVPFAAHHWTWYTPRQPVERYEIGEIWAAGGLTSTVSDLAKLLSQQFRAYSGDSDILSSPSIAESHSIHAMPYGEWTDENAGIGLGWYVRPFGTASVRIEHDGNADGHSAYWAALADQGVGLIVLANLGGVADEIGEQLWPLVEKPVVALRSNIGTALREGDAEAALEAAKALLQINPRNRNMNYWAGRFYTEMDSCSDAEPYLQKADSYGAYRERVAFYQAICAARAGNAAASQANLLRAFKMGFVDAEKILEFPALSIIEDSDIYQLLIERYAH